MAEEVELGVHEAFQMGLERQKTGDLEVPQYTIAEMRIRPSVPITRGHIDAEGMTYNGELLSGGELLVVRMPLVKNTTFSIHLATSALGSEGRMALPWLLSSGGPVTRARSSREAGTANDGLYPFSSALRICRRRGTISSG